MSVIAAAKCSVSVGVSRCVFLPFDSNQTRPNVFIQHSLIRGPT